MKPTQTIRKQQHRNTHTSFHHKYKLYWLQHSHITHRPWWSPISALKNYAAKCAHIQNF